ncbi:Transcription factor MYB1R1 [Triticum urartu]|uniref:Transcription factor MYB1R1 n=1 Tax=Triticum urartu TaxID=4572 RepID=M8ATW5_TRIUA|nr:Transcription factor MYB1R1 [Triticum urartu]
MKRNSRVFGSGQSKNEGDTVDMIFGDLRTWATAGIDEMAMQLFLLGLKTYGKGDWRNISRNFVRTRTPTQVASHAQKYFIRLSSGTARRSSIHDITTVHLTDDQPPSPSQ